MKTKKHYWLVLLIATIAVISNALGLNEASEADAEVNFALNFLWIAIILIAAKLSSLVEKFGQPAVLGELVIGVVLGNLVLAGIGVFESIKEDMFIAFLGQLGAVILLFQIGLESSVEQMKKVGFRAFLVAVVGVAVPFIAGTFIVGPWILPGLSFNAYLFLGATLTATSVGITARVFRDVGKLNTPEAQIVLGAAVIDDVLGLVILAVVSAIVTAGSVSFEAVAIIILKSVLFLAIAIILGPLIAPSLGRLFSRIHTGVGMKFTLAICFGLILAYLANLIGLAPIVGAFAAGLILDPVHFKYFKEPEVIDDIKENIKDASAETKDKFASLMQKHSDKHIRDIIEPVGLFLVPIFFVMAGIAVDLKTLFDLNVVLIALGITVVAVFGKVASGLVAGDVRKSIVGWGMVPRGEVGLIFAATGKALGVVSDQVFSIIVIVIMLTTLIIPPILAYLLRKEDKIRGD